MPYFRTSILSTTAAKPICHLSRTQLQQLPGIQRRGRRQQQVSRTQLRRVANAYGLHARRFDRGDPCGRILHADAVARRGPKQLRRLEEDLRVGLALPELSRVGDRLEPMGCAEALQNQRRIQAGRGQPRRDSPLAQESSSSGIPGSRSAGVIRPIICL